MGKRLYVGNLPYDADEDSIREAFANGGGTVERVHLPLDRESQRPRGFAFVDMASEEEAQAALLAMNGATLGTRTLKVSEAEDGRSSRPRPGDGARDDRPPGGPRPAPTGDRPAGPPQRESRPHRFGPDSKPLRERGRGSDRDRDRDRRGGKRSHGDDDSDFHGRRGSKRFDEDDD